MYEVFRGEVEKVKKIHGLTNRDLSEKTGIPVSTISAFMCGVRNSDNTAQAIAKVLNIDL